MMFPVATSRAEKLFVELKFVMRDNKRSEEKLQEERRLQIHTALVHLALPGEMKCLNKQHGTKNHMHCNK